MVATVWLHDQGEVCGESNVQAWKLKMIGFWINLDASLQNEKIVSNSFLTLQLQDLSKVSFL